MISSLRNTLKPYVTLPLWIALYLIVAGIIGNMTRDEIPNWYQGLAKPDLNPPDWVFPIVWTTLYIMIAIAGWRIWQNRNSGNGKILLSLFAVQTVMNWIWSYLFFDFHWLGISFGWIIGLVICVAALIYRSDRINKALLIPYLLWISFASYLNFMIWQLN